MKLTPQQEYIMKLLKTFRCLKNDQIDRLVCSDMNYEPVFAKRQRERMLELCGHLLSHPLSGCSGMKGAVPDIDLMDAMDVMLVFIDKGVEVYLKGSAPFKLSFVKKSKDGYLRAYYVAVVHKGAEFLISQQALGACKSDKNVVLFLLDDIAQADAIEFPHDHYYVVRQENGLRFYRGVTDEK